MQVLQNDFQFLGIDKKLFASNKTTRSVMGDLEYYVNSVENNPDPQLFGLHANSEFTRAISQGNQLQQHVLSCLHLTSQPQDSSAPQDSHEALHSTVTNIRE